MVNPIYLYKSNLDVVVLINISLVTKSKLTETIFLIIHISTSYSIITTHSLIFKPDFIKSWG